MTAQRLPAGLTCYRIGDPDGAFPIFDARGSAIGPGRWNRTISPFIYASEHYSTALLEKLVHGAGSLPPNQHYIEIQVPAGGSYEVFQPAGHSGWDLGDCRVSRDFGHAWAQEARSVILLVPSVVAHLDRNVLINPRHPEFARITCGLHVPVYWDSRLFP